MPEPASEKNLRKIKACLLGGAIFLTLLLVVAAVAVMFSANETAWLPRKTMMVLLLCFAPFPIVSNLFLIHAVNRYSEEAKESATRDALTGLYNQRVVLAT